MPVKFTVLLDRSVGRWIYRRHLWLYRVTNGRIGHRGPLGPMLVLSMRGARSGLNRDVALLYYRRGDDLYVVASNGGRPGHPAWLTNVRTHPAVKLRVGRQRFDAVARILDADERASLWTTLVEFYPGWAHYQTLTERALDVVNLKPAPENRPEA